MSSFANESDFKSGNSFFCEKCVEAILEPNRRLIILGPGVCEENLLAGEQVERQCGSQGVLRARTRIEWIKFRKCGWLLRRRKLSLSNIYRKTTVCKQLVYQKLKCTKKGGGKLLHYQ